MQQATVGTKYQIVIPKEVRRKIKSLKPGAKVVVKKVNEDTITVTTTNHIWSDDSYGFMKGAWKGIDPIVEIEKMRNEWDEELK